MKNALKKGFSFGLTSGVITTLGLMVGLESSTESKLAVIGGILAIAVADAFSDALGMHISQESEGKNSVKDVWLSTISTFIAKFFFAMTFAVPVLLLSLTTAVIVSIVWGLSLIGIFSVYMAKLEKISAWKTVFEHVGIAIVVIILTHYLGHFIKTLG
jgi:VIT1/CCC1 family predicted Fe2+/Mn2+ transporter